MMCEEPETPLEWHINRLIELGVFDATIVVRRTYGEKSFMFVDVLGPPSVNYGGEPYAINARSWNEVEEQVRAYIANRQAAAEWQLKCADEELNTL